MSPDDHSFAFDHDTIERVFGEAIALAPEMRARFLDEQCTGRPDLRNEIASLIAAHEGQGPLDMLSPLDGVSMGMRDGAASTGGSAASGTAGIALRGEGGVGAAGAEAVSASGGRAGRVIGQFRLLDEIGRGGMGVVYRAERRDGQFTQRVAIKLIPLGPWAGADALRRYRAERQILAALKHPHIVTLIDAGLTEDGQAYLVMEEVDGAPITRDCKARGRSLVERLRLFQDVCGAVHHAHQHAVVHRDLKPANILVTGDGVVKVLDFGVAKLLDETASEEDRTLVGGPRPLTPNYASPEQLRGLPVTTSCDIYALGVLLFELVTGSRPYETAGLTLDRVLALVTEREPPRASTRAAFTGAPTPPRALMGDIDAIVSKAMHKDPGERYASAQALSEDITRHLEGQPIVAREPSLGYLMAKLVRRHTGAFIAALITVVALATAFGVSLYQTRVATASRARADARFADVRQLANSLIFKIQDDVQGLPGSTPVRKAVTAEALAYLEKLSADPSGDDGLRLDLATAYQRIGRVQGLPAASNLGDRPGALQSFRKAIALVRPLAFGPQARRDAALLLAHIDIDVATTERVDEHHAEADAALREAHGIADVWMHLSPADAEVRRLMGSVYFSEAVDASKDALPIWQKARQVFASLLVEQPNNLDFVRAVALIEKYMGEEYASGEDWASALAHYAAALDLDQQRVTRSPGSRTARMDLALDVSNVARAHRGSGHLEEAAAGYGRSLGIRQQLADADPQDAYARGRVAFAHYMLGVVYRELHRTAEALAQGREAVSIEEGLASQGQSETFELGRYLTTLGKAQQQAGDRAGACQTWRRAAGILLPMRPSTEGASTQHTTVVREEIDDVGRVLAGCERGAAR